MFKAGNLNESESFKKILEPWIRKLIREETQNCVRRRALTVVTAPNGTTMGVSEPFDETVMDLPYLASLSGKQVGDTVTVEWAYGLSNARVVG